MDRNDTEDTALPCPYPLIVGTRQCRVLGLYHSEANGFDIRSQKIARAFSELGCTFGGRSIVPDVSVFLWNRIPRQENGAVANVFSIAPDWAIEILSPDQSQTKVTKNILHCLAGGTQMGWPIDPSEQCVFVYLRDRPTTFYDEPDILLPVPEFAREFNLTVTGLFSWLLE